jgi:lipopolysaccharide export system permease protein
LDDLVDAGKSNGNVAKIIIGYYGPYSLSLFTRLCPFFALMAILFVVSWLKRTNELTALMAAGIPKGRILRFPLYGVIALILTSTLIREFVIPQHQDILGKQPQDLSGENFRPLQFARDPKTGILIGGHHVELLNEQIIFPIFRWSTLSTPIGRQIKADRAEYKPANDQHPAGYHVLNVTSPENFGRFDSIVLDDEAAVITHRQASWLQPNDCFVVSTVPFFLLHGGASWSQYESTWNIIKRLHTQPTFFGPDVHVTAHARLVQPFLDVTLVLFGLPLVLQRVDRHLFWVSSAVMGSVAIFFAINLTCQTIASNNNILSPFMGAWLPMAIICPIAWARVRVAMQS